ncbi:50S ribosomal protein L10 [uncultured archaeon]|nr:50S ribosomal protein L10 [uncultured archaeon]
MKPETHASDLKKRTVKELTELIKKKRTILVVSIKNIPASQFQELVKKLRGRAVVKVPRRNLITMAIDNSGETAAKEMESKIKENIAVLFSDVDCFELAAELVKSKSPAKANAGQESPEDIEIPAGPTDLVPGPAISELGAVGIQIQIDKGKISIKEPKIIVRKGEKISPAVADVLNKLDIKPFSISLVPLAGYDSKDKKAYLTIQIDIEKTIADLKTAFGKALPFAVEVGYVSEDTIKFLIQKAGRHELALGKLTSNTPQLNEGEGNN